MVINEYAPTMKQVKPINFLFFRTETTVGELEKFLPIANDLFREAFEKKLRITGPIHWHYFGFSTDVQNTFTLEVALPVADIIGEYDGNFHFKRSEPFKCVSLMHEGSWSELPKSYGSLMEFIMKKNFKVSGVNREIYINTDFINQDANITEVQIGIL
jgi:effector-binding domain-containing protein